MREYSIVISKGKVMSAFFKHVFKFLSDAQNNPPALMTVVALASMAVAGFAMYVVLMVVRP
jgi:hypothetical protein